MLQNKSIDKYKTLVLSKKSFCNKAVHIVNFVVKDAKKCQEHKKRLPYPISTAYYIRERGEHRKISADSESRDTQNTN